MSWVCVQIYQIVQRILQGGIIPPVQLCSKGVHKWIYLTDFKNTYGALVSVLFHRVSFESSPRNEEDPQGQIEFRISAKQSRVWLRLPSLLQPNRFQNKHLLPDKVAFFPSSFYYSKWLVQHGVESQNMSMARNHVSQDACGQGLDGLFIDMFFLGLNQTAAVTIYTWTSVVQNKIGSNPN